MKKEVVTTEYLDVIERISAIETTLIWLKEDRIEQKQSYEKRKAFIRKIQYGIVLGFFSFIGVFFEHRESIRLAIRDWIIK